MAIDRITRLKNYGVFHDFTWPANLPGFARYNLIYGWNGSGKTLLSGIFRDLEAKTPPSSHVTVMINGQAVSNDDFAQVAFPVRVFNRDFVAESVFRAKGNIEPIFVLGKENVDKQKQVAQLKKILVDEQVKLNANRLNKTNASSALEKFRIDKAKVIKDALRSSGSNPYNDYNKGEFSQRAEAMVSAGDKDARLLNDTTRDKLLTQLRSSLKEELQPLTYRLPDLKTLEKTVADRLSTTVVSAAIQSLKDNAKLSSWVHIGLGIHQEHKYGKCLFCDQPIPKDRLSDLEAHFSTEYEDLLQKLANQITTIQAAIRTATELVIPNAAEFYDYLSSEFQLAAAALYGERDSAKRVLETLVKALEDKKSHAFERVALDVTVPKMNAGVVDNLNVVILKHNQACDNFQSKINSARERLEANSIATALDEFLKLRDTVQAAEAEVTKTNNETQRLASEIEKLEQEIVEHRRPAEELNEDLRNYLGHNELRLYVQDTGYTIMRHDTPAKSLSEGEMTAIALLYFLKRLTDQRFDLTKGVVVLDDPVSSLDANALYSAFGFIRERTQHASQLFILTHNFAFFRQVHNWYKHIKDRSKKSGQPAHFYMLDCTRDQQRRCSAIRLLDPLLKDFDSEYHYLFAYIYSAATASPRPPLEQNYMLPNLARRLLESFLAFKQPISSGLREKLNLVQFDKAKKTRIIRFLHTYSHSSAIGEPEHDLSLLSEAQSILKNLLELMQSQDPGHFAAMVSRIQPSDSADKEG
ncbi:MAG: AAA family ATPase [Phycisphaerae bacterium]|nr:AAA family ATPase [Phycisphaerae bacterium]